MAPLIIQVVSWLIFRSMGALGVEALDSWVDALRWSLAMMFVVTGCAHFAPAMRRDLVRMVPPSLPWPEGLVMLTGVLELAGAAGLLVPWLTRAAAWCLVAMLAAMFPANIHAARAGVTLGGKPPTPLVWRVPEQLYWMGCLVAVALA